MQRETLKVDVLIVGGGPAGLSAAIRVAALSRRIGGEPLTDSSLRKQILLYFGLIAFIFMLSWVALIAIEDDATWAGSDNPLSNKLDIDMCQIKSLS